MNLRALANAFTQSINNNLSITWRQSTGATTDQYYHRSPSFTDVTIDAQVQALSGDDLKHVDGLNISAVMRKVYAYGDIESLVRSAQKGGDVLIFPPVPGQEDVSWKVVQVTETWPDWCCVIVAMQEE